MSVKITRSTIRVVLRSLQELVQYTILPIVFIVFLEHLSDKADGYTVTFAKTFLAVAFISFFARTFWRLFAGHRVKALEFSEDYINILLRSGEKIECSWQDLSSVKRSRDLDWIWHLTFKEKMSIPRYFFTKKDEESVNNIIVNKAVSSGLNIGFPNSLV